MKAILLVLFLTGCATKCPECLVITPTQLGVALQKAWSKGWDEGFSDGEDSESKKRVKTL